MIQRFPEQSTEYQQPLFTEHDDSGSFRPFDPDKAGFTGATALSHSAEIVEEPQTELTAAHILGEIIVQPVRESLSKEQLAKRNRFIRGFNWIPESEQEASIAVRTLRGRILDNASKHLSVVTKIINSVDGFRAGSQNALETLKEAATGDQDWFEPQPSAIRDNPEVVLVMTNYAFNKDCLDNFSWPDKSRRGHANPQREQALINLRSQIEAFGDDDLSALWRQAYANYYLKMRYWHDQAGSVEDIDRVREARRPQAA